MARPCLLGGLGLIVLLPIGCGRSDDPLTATVGGDERGAAAAAGATGAAGATVADASGFDFVDVAAQAGVEVVNVCGDPRRWYILESNGNGAGWLDYDGDGDMDLFVGNGLALTYVDDGRRLEVVHGASSRLYRNDGSRPGGWRFTDVTDETGAARSDWISAVTVADYDNDGDSDLYLAGFGPDVLLRNDGGRFTDATAEAGLGCELWGAGAAFGDADNDGDLDLYVANYVLFDPEHPPDGGKRMVIDGVEVGIGPEAENQRGLNTGAPDVFYRNDGDGHFTDATAAAGLALPRRCARTRSCSATSTATAGRTSSSPTTCRPAISSTTRATARSRSRARRTASPSTATASRPARWASWSRTWTATATWMCCARTSTSR
jgi:hypothetical protein